MKKTMRFMNGLIYGLTAIFVAMLAILIFANALMRYAFNSSIVWATELASFLLIWLVVLGAVITLKDNEHLSVKSFVKLFPLRGRRIVYGIGNVLILIACSVLFIGCWKLTMLNLHSRAASTGLPMVLIYGSVLVMSAGMIVVVLINLYKLFFSKTPIDELFGLHADNVEAEIDKRGDSPSNS